MNTPHQKLGIALGVLVIIIVGVATYMGESGPAQTTYTSTSVATQTTNPTPKPVVAQTPPVTIPKNIAYAYKNGTYSANGMYMSPGGQDEISVTLTVANDIVTDATVTPVSGDNTSLRYQNYFISGYKQYVIGQKLSSINLTRVSGSSLTPEGFDAALAKIKAQAQA